MNPNQYSIEDVRDLTDRIFALREKLEEGKIHIAEHLADGFQVSWEAIRLRSDGLVDPDTVDGRIRSMTLAVRAFQYRQEVKDSMSLGEIQDLYFSYLDRQFGHFYREMIGAKATPHQYSQALVRNSEFVSRSLSSLPDLVEELRDFWQVASEAGLIHLQESDQLKALFAGDIFPQHWGNIVSTAGLYLDTIVLPCPIMRLQMVLQTHPHARTFALLMKHVLTAMGYRDLATADVVPPLVLIVPSEDEVSGSDRSELIARSTPLALSHAKHVFDRDFESIGDLSQFCSEFREQEGILREVRRGDRLLFDSDWPRTPAEQLRRAIESGNPLPPAFDVSHAGHQVLNSILGRMPQALDAREKSVNFGGTPIISAQTSWEYFTWMLEYSSEGPADSVTRDRLHMAHAMAASENIQWLGKVPPEAVLEIRRRGQAEEVRAMLSDGISMLTKISPDNYSRTASRVSHNLDRAFQEHQKSLREAAAERRGFYGVDVGGCLAVGTIAVAAAFTASPTLGAISGLLGIAGISNLRDIKSRYSEIRRKERERAVTPTGILFKHLE